MKKTLCICFCLASVLLQAGCGRAPVPEEPELPVFEKVGEVGPVSERSIETLPTPDAEGLRELLARADPARRSVEKTRWRIPYAGHILEIDVFPFWRRQAFCEAELTREDEPLDGFDPYSNSKSCSELVTHSYKSSFFDKAGIAVSTARAGNVIGGGDFAANRIIPDCVRAAVSGEPIKVRNPNSIRPYQHVLEPLNVYLMIASGQYEDSALQGYYNVGPDDKDCLTTGDLAGIFCSEWGNGQTYTAEHRDGPHEANYLKLDCSLLKKTFGWKPVWDAPTAVSRTVEWTRVWADGGDVPAITEKQIKEFFI